MIRVVSRYFSSFQAESLARSGVLFAAAIISLRLLLPASAHADDRSNRQKLFSGAAVQRADERQALRSGTSDSAAVFSGFGRSLDSLEDVLLTNNFVQSYRGTLRSYDLNLGFTRGVGSDRELEADEHSIAEHLMIRQGIETMADMIENSPVEQAIKTVGRKLKQLRNYTTVHVAENNHGSFKWRRGTSAAKPLVQLKLDANLNRGIGPKLEIKDFMQLRMDPLKERALLEMYFNF